MAFNPTAEKAKDNVEQVKSNLQERFPEFKKRASDITHQVEERARRLPESAFLTAAGLSIIASAVLAITSRQKPVASFVGLWVPSLLLMGIYTKLLKMEKKGTSIV